VEAAAKSGQPTIAIDFMKPDRSLKSNKYCQVLVLVAAVTLRFIGAQCRGFVDETENYVLMAIRIVVPG
jgi:hypothetical protein